MPIPFGEQPLGQDHYLRVIARALPADYLEQLRARPDSGYELLQAVAAMAARVDLAITRALQGNLAIHASGGARAGGTVTLVRPADSGMFTVLAGSVVSSSSSGRRYLVTQDVEWASPDLTVDVTVQAVASGWEYDARGQRTTAAGEVLPGLVDTVVSLITDPAYADPEVTVTQSADIVGGAFPALDLVAEDRGLGRGAAEGDASLALRTRTLPDTVSPGAVRRLVAGLLAPAGLPYDLVETWEHRYQECYDAPSPNAGTPSYLSPFPSNPLYSSDTYVYDDPRPPSTLFRNRTMDEVEYRATYVLVLDRDVTLQDVGLAYDDPGVSSGDFHPSTGPQRGTSAYDLTSAMDPQFVFGCCYDGYDAEERALVAAVAQKMQAITAAGATAVVDYKRE